METNFKDVGFATKAYTKIVKRYINAGVRIDISPNVIQMHLLIFTDYNLLLLWIFASRRYQGARPDSA